MNPLPLPLGSPKSEEVEEGQEVTEDFVVSVPSPQVLPTEQNAELSGSTLPQNQPSSGATAGSSTAGEPLAGGEVQLSVLQRQPLSADLTHSSSGRNSATGTIPKNRIAGPTSDLKRSLPIPIVEKPTEESRGSKSLWEDTGAIPKYLTQEYAQKAPKYLPPFTKPNTPKPKRKKEPSSEVPEKFEVLPSVSSESAASSSPFPEPPRERRSSRSERSQFVREQCLDFQDYKRTVNNRQKSLEQSLNQVLPKMKSAMKDSEKLATKIAKVRSQVCDTEELMRTQNDKLKYLVGRTVGTISKIDVLFDRFRTDILDYTTLTTEGNEGIDMRLSRLLKILCGLEEKDLAKEKNKPIREAFFSEESGSKE